MPIFISPKGFEDMAWGPINFHRRPLSKLKINQTSSHTAAPQSECETTRKKWRVGCCGSSLVQFEVSRDDFSPIMTDKKLNRTQSLVFEELHDFWHVPNSSNEHWMISDVVGDKEGYISDKMSHWMGWFILDTNRKKTRLTKGGERTEELHGETEQRLENHVSVLSFLPVHWETSQW